MTTVAVTYDWFSRIRGAIIYTRYHEFISIVFRNKCVMKTYLKNRKTVICNIVVEE